VNRRDFQLLAETRLVDARVLLAKGRFDAAYYLAGYSVECALKACISKSTKRYQFPLSAKEVNDIYCHDFKRLVKAAGLTTSLQTDQDSDQELQVNWAVVYAWSEITRYDRRGKSASKNASDFIKAVGDPDHGVFQCIKKYW
jgi:hypothetical protein